MSHQVAISEERKQRFLEALRTLGGSVAAACAATASEHHGPSAARSSWYDLRKRDPEFAQAWDEAQLSALGQIEAEIHRRAMEPAKTPVTDRQGNVVGHKEDRLSSDRLLLRLASRLDPEAWAERRKNELNVSGTVTHAAFSIRPDLVSQLPRERQEQLIDILDELAAIDNGLDPTKAVGHEE